MAKTKTRTTTDLPLLSMSAAATMLGLSYATLQVYATKGKVPFVRDSTNRRLFRPSDLQALKAAREKAAK